MAATIADSTVLFRYQGKPNAESGAEWNRAQNIGRDDRMCAYGAARIKVDLGTIQSADNSINHIACWFSDPPQRSLVPAANPQTSFI